MIDERQPPLPFAEIAVADSRTDERWFAPDDRGRLPVFVASPWGYTKPADAIRRLDHWAAGIGEFSETTPLDIRSTPGSRLVRHPRIISWAFYGDTEWTRRMAAACDGRLPVPSQDTFLWYCAARRGDFFRRVNMKRHGWRHLKVKALSVEQADGRFKRTPSVAPTDAAWPATEHARQLIELIGSLDPHEAICGVEIGVAQGETSESLLRFVPALHLTMVDSWATYGDEHPYRRSGDGCAGLSAEEQSAREQTARLRTEFAGDRRRIIRTESAAAADQFKDASLDFAFIDADHTYEGVRRDIARWWPKIRPGGLFAGHDYDGPRDRRGIWGVAKAVNEFAAGSGLEVRVGRGYVWSVRKPEVAGLNETSSSPVAVTTPSASTRGVVCLLTGAGHGPRLIVTLHSLRKHWPGPVTLYTTNPTSHEIGRLCAADETLRVDHRIWSLYSTRRNASYLTKAHLPRHVPYDECIFLDADTLVVGPLDELWGGLRKAPLVLTQFAAWTTRTRNVRRRLEGWRTLCDSRWPPAQRDRMISAALQPHPAVNVGVFAFRRDADALRRWEELAAIGRRKFICDEIAMQLLLPELNAEVLDYRFNCSPVYAKSPRDVRIWHFHGDKHLRPEKRDLWLREYEECVRREIADIHTWGPELDEQLAQCRTAEAAR